MGGGGAGGLEVCKDKVRRKRRGIKLKESRPTCVQRK